LQRVFIYVTLQAEGIGTFIPAPQLSSPREKTKGYYAMKITALLENTTERNDMQVEHGLSLYIETDTHKILFDMGQSNLFAKNAETLGIDLSAVDIAVLSHGHYDHGGGLKTFLSLNDKAPVYINRFAFEPHFNASDKYIGLDASLKTTLVEQDRLRFTAETCTLAPGLTLFSCNERARSCDLGSFGLTVLDGNNHVPDDFRHEQYLLIEEKDLRVLISGCSHKGIQNIMEWFSPDVLVGGFHFMKLDPGDTLDTAARALNKYSTRYFTGHCTGEEQFAYLKERMERLEYLSCGKTIEL